MALPSMRKPLAPDPNVIPAALEKSALSLKGDVRVDPGNVRNKDVLGVGATSPTQLAPVLQRLSPPPPSQVALVWANATTGINAAHAHSDKSRERTANERFFMALLCAGGHTNESPLKISRFRQNTSEKPKK